MTINLTTNNETSNAMTLDVFDLNRTFRRIPDSSAESNVETMPYSRRNLGRFETWNTLLKHPCIVVLGELGSGKTSEFRLRTEMLTTQGHHSFFIDLPDLAANGLKSSLDASQLERLEQWRSSLDNAYFFLDSLDEAKIQNYSLGAALKNLRTEISTQWNQAKLILSCRGSDWTNKKDQKEILDTAPESIAEVLVVQISPLDTNQIKKLAQKSGVENVNEFLNAIEKNHSHTFIERPLDIRWIGVYWEQNKDIGNYQNLIEYNIREKLKEDRLNRPTPMSPMEAESGAQVLAAVAIFQNKWSFALPKLELDVHNNIKAIDPRDFLPNWDTDKISELLRKPIFIESSIDHMKFHHRTVQEFLAARWLYNLSEEGMSAGKLMELFFYEENDKRIVPSHLAPIAAWLSLWNYRVKYSVIKHAPWILIAYGNPSALDIEDRKAIILSYAKAYQGRNHRFEYFDRDALRRFADHELSESIVNLINDHETPNDLIVLLFEIIEYGEISNCIDTCLTFALDLNKDSYVRYSAIRAIESAGNRDQKVSLLKLLDKTRQWRQDIAGAFISTLYPDIIDVNGMIKILNSISRPKFNEMTTLQNVLKFEISSKGKINQQLELLDELLKLVWITTDNDNDNDNDKHVLHDKRWLITPIAQIVCSIINGLPDKNEVPENIVTALKAIRWCMNNRSNFFEQFNDLLSTINRHLKVKQIIFWRFVSEIKQTKNSKKVVIHDVIDYFDIISFGKSDREWLSLDVRNQELEVDKILAFDILIRIVANHYDIKEREDFIIELINSHESINTHYNRSLQRENTKEDPHIKALNRKWKAQEIKRERQNSRNREELEKRIVEIRAGTDIEALRFIYNHADRIGSSYGNIGLSSINDKFGNEVSSASIEGFQAFWRTYSPPLPNEREERNSTTIDVAMGLAGIHLNFDNGLKSDTLNSEEVKIATIHAMYELGKFPDWLIHISKDHPQLVFDVLSPFVIEDMTLPNDGTPSHHILDKLSHADNVIRNLFSQFVAIHIRDNNIPRIDSIINSLKIILSDNSISHNNFSVTAREQCTSNILDEQRFAVWWIGWFYINPVDSFDFLEENLSNFSEIKAYQFVLQICHRIRILLDFHGFGEMPIQNHPQLLKKCIQLVYKYIKPEDDNEHETVYSPDTRDDAESMRSRLISWLVDIPGPETVDVLEELSNDRRLKSIKNWLLHLANQRIVANNSNSKHTTIEKLIGLIREHGTLMSKHLGDLGRKNTILIVEGSINSPDIKLYKEMFPSAEIFPVGNRRDVNHRFKEHQRIKNTALERINVFAIVDGDANNIDGNNVDIQSKPYVLNFYSVESLFFHPIIIARLEKFKNEYKLSGGIEHQVFKTVTQKRDDLIKTAADNKWKEAAINASNLSTNMHKTILIIRDGDKFRKIVTEMLDDALAQKDLLSILKICNIKPIVGDIVRVFKKNNESYLNDVCDLIQGSNNTDLPITKEIFPELWDAIENS